MQDWTEDLRVCTTSAQSFIPVFSKPTGRESAVGGFCSSQAAHLVHLRKVLIQQGGLGVPNMQEPTRLRWETCDHLALYCILQAHLKGATRICKQQKSACCHSGGHMRLMGTQATREK